MDEIKAEADDYLQLIGLIKLFKSKKHILKGQRKI